MPIGNPRRDLDNIIANVREFEKINQAELILVIDSPRCPETSLLSKAFSENRNVIVLQCSLGNPGAARNLGKEHSNGEWLSFVDSDDSVDFKNYYQMVLEGNYTGSEIVIGKYRIIDDSGIVRDVIEDISHQSVARSIARNPGIWRLSFKRNLVDGIHFPSLRMAEDQVFLARLRFWERNISVSQLVVYTYRQNIPGQLTRSKDAISDLIQAQEITLTLYLNEQPKSVGSQILATVVINQFMTSLKHLRLQGLVPLRGIYRAEGGIFQALRLSARLSRTLLTEILDKTNKIKKASGAK